MRYILKRSDGTPVDSSDFPILADQARDAFRDQDRIWFDPRPSQGGYVDIDDTPAAPVVPLEVTMRQARLALLEAGLLSAVTTAIGQLPGGTQEAAMIEWEYSSTVQRHNGFVAALAPALGLSEAQLDALFIRAQAL